MTEPLTIPLSEALKALGALRDAAGLPPEQFPLPAFVGMISDEVEALRAQGRTDADIASMIEAATSIHITGDDIADHFATPEDRHPHAD